MSPATRPDQTSCHSASATSASSCSSRAVGELAEQERPAAVERFENGLADGVGLGDVAEDGKHEIGRMQLDPPVAAGQRAGTRPEHLAGAEQLIEHRGGVVGHPGGQHQALPRRRRQRQPGQLVDDGEHAVGATHGGHRLPATTAGSERTRPGRPARPADGPPPATGCAAA